MPAKSNTKEFIEKSIKIHGDTYNYFFVDYKGSGIKVDIWCKTHQVFFKQKPNHHLRGVGCPHCANNIKLTTKQFIEKANKVHNHNFIYDKTEYKTSGEKVWIECKNGHMFEQIAKDHLNGFGCSECSGHKKYTKESFIEKAIKVHKNKFFYDKTIFIDMNTDIEIGCKKHGYFLQNPRNHIFGSKCPSCAKGSISLRERAWLNKIKDSGVNLYRQFYIKKLKMKVDGFDPITKTIYEFHGDYWHGNPIFFKPQDYNIKAKDTYGNLYQQTLEREFKILESGYNLIVMWECDFEEEYQLILKNLHKS